MERSGRGDKRQEASTAVRCGRDSSGRLVTGRLQDHPESSSVVESGAESSVGANHVIRTRHWSRAEMSIGIRSTGGSSDSRSDRPGFPTAVEMILRMTATMTNNRRRSDLNFHQCRRLVRAQLGLAKLVIIAE